MTIHWNEQRPDIGPAVGTCGDDDLRRRLPPIIMSLFQAVDEGGLWHTMGVATALPILCSVPFILHLSFLTSNIIPDIRGFGGSPPDIRGMAIHLNRSNLTSKDVTLQ